MPNYTGLANPYAVSNPIATGLATAQQVINLRGSLQDQQDQTQDREARRGLVGLQTRAAQLGVDRAEREQQDEDTKRGLIRQFAVGDEAGGASGLTGLALQRPATMPQSPPTAQPAKPDAETTKENLVRLGTVGEDRLKAAGDPEHFNALADFATGMQEGNPQLQQQSWPAVIKAYNAIHRDDIAKGVGEKRADGSTIIGKEVVDFHGNDERGFVPVLNVTAVDKDGKRFTYQAPVTKDRNSDPNSPLAFKSYDDLSDDLHGALEAGYAVQSGQVKPGDARAAARQQWISHGFDPDEFDKRVGAAKPTGNLESVQDSSGKRMYVRAYSDGSFRGLDGNVVTDFSPYEKTSQSLHTVGRALVDPTGKVLYRDPEPQKTGTSLTVGPDGTVQFNDGVTGASPTLAKPTANALEETIVKSQAGLDRLRNIQRSFDPKFLNLQHQVGSAVAGLKDKVGIASDADKQTVAQYEGFKSKTLNNLNLYIKDITGAAMSETEAARIKSAVPSLEDGPTAFKAKMDSTIHDLSRAQARAYYTRKNGLDMSAVPLSNMDQIIDEYGANVERQIKAANPSLEQTEIDKLAHEQVRRAFGM